MDLKKYQARAIRTSIVAKERSPETALAAVLGLASETGSILDIWKRYLRDQINLDENKGYLEVELGDLLWYVATVARALDLDLGKIATRNLQRAHDLYGERTPRELNKLPVLDRGYVRTERFPRKLVVKFAERPSRGRARAELTLIDAVPNAFPNGAIEEPGGKRIGYNVGKPLGAALDDNSRREDNYRYHDAIHLGFMATLGWSPTTRDLLRVKRKSDIETDRVEDGARAIYLEEGLAAVLARMSLRRGHFRSESSIDGEVVDIAQVLVNDLEVRLMPGWMWRRAIHAGFSVMQKLSENKGGFVTANLDKRTLVYSKTRPAIR